jgi:hypothetical protein
MDTANTVMSSFELEDAAAIYFLYSGRCEQRAGWRINNVGILQHKFKVQSLQWFFVLFRD